MIELERVAKHYANRTVVDDVSFTVGERETFVLLGRSGSGKTTTLKMINRLVEPTSGTIRLFGAPLGARPKEELRRSIGYVIQDVGLFPHYTVRKNVAVVPELLGWGPARIRARVDELLHQVGLPPEGYADAFPRELSGGQQQRVGLARALAGDPPLLLMDEPFGALDPITRRRMEHDLLELSVTLGKTVVLVTHDVAEAVLYGDRIGLFEAGRIVQLGTPRELLLCPSSDFVKSFFDEARLTLELRVIRLGELARYLDATRARGTSSEPAVDMTSSTRAHEALEHPALAQGAVCRIRDERGAIVGTADATQLFEAFHALTRSARSA